MIDSHCHLGIDNFKEDIEGILKRAQRAGITKILTVACEYNQINDLLSMIQNHENVFGAFGIHPENASLFDYEKTVEVFKVHPEITALGEIGLDYYYNADTKEIQLSVFKKQIEIAAQQKKPIIIHTRDADEDTEKILKTAYKNNLLSEGGVLHCFTGSEELAKTALDIGFYISASGIITFKNSNNLRETFKKIPIENLLIETDSPYLAPVPYRGEQNEPAYVAETLKILSEIKEVDVEKMEEITSQNFNRLFLKRTK